MAATQADAVMIGRGAQGNPWIFREIDLLINHNRTAQKPNANEIYQTMIAHLEHLYSFYGGVTGVKIARKHIGWYLKQVAFVRHEAKSKINQACQPDQQIAMINSVFS